MYIGIKRKSMVVAKANEISPKKINGFSRITNGGFKHEVQL
jgi:hypothetical protein